MKRFLVLIAWMVLLSSCCIQQPKKKDRYIANKLDINSSALDNVRLQEAKMVDIPIPLSAKPLPEYFDPDNPIIILGYEDTTLSPAGIEDFYAKEMERLGWEAKEQFIGHESNLRFTNSERSCLISVRFDEEKQCTCFIISTGARETIFGENMVSSKF